MKKSVSLLSLLLGAALVMVPAGKKIDSTLLPNGWKITPVGRALHTEDMVLNLVPAPDGKAVVGAHGGFNQHGLVTIDATSEEIVQRIPLNSTFLGLAWHPGGKKLYVSGGNDWDRNVSPIYVFSYANGRLSDKPVTEFTGAKDPGTPFVSWSGMVHHPTKDLLFAADRGTGSTDSNVLVLDSNSGAVVNRIAVGMAPYDVELSPDKRTLWVSNWASASVSAIDLESQKVVATVAVDRNPNDIAIARDGRIFVACATDNSVAVIDGKTYKLLEKINTSLYPQSPTGSTPNALVFDAAQKFLYVANADNNNLAVVEIASRQESKVRGFIPTGWYPSALALSANGQRIYIANGKGLKSLATPRGPGAPNTNRESIKTVIRGSIHVADLGKLHTELKQLTQQVFDNTPYRPSQLKAAAKPAAASVVPSAVGVGSPIKHVIYIIKENRTYDQVLGDLPQGNGDPNLTIFPRKVTPNQHALAEEFVLFDNLNCDGEVSVDGHQWSNAAYATDFVEKHWPPQYGKQSKPLSQGAASPAVTPAAGYLWDMAAKKGLTYRSYGEFGRRESDTMNVNAIASAKGLQGHLAPGFKKAGYRDPDNAREFIREFDEFEKTGTLPNYIVMSLGENHTRGTAAGACTPIACVASNDLAVGMVVERVSHSKYWAQTAIFIIEDDAQNGPDHVDAHRTTGFAISPYIKRGTVDKTAYSTSSMLRTIELLLGMEPMSQYDAAATPMYAAFGATPNLKPYTCLAAQVDLNEKNTKRAWGSAASLAMNFDEYDAAPEDLLNEIIWRSVKGADSPMPAPVRRFRRE